MPGFTGVHVNSPSNKVSVMTKQSGYSGGKTKTGHINFTNGKFRVRVRKGTLPSGAKYSVTAQDNTITSTATKGASKLERTKDYSKGKNTYKSENRTREGKLPNGRHYEAEKNERGTTVRMNGEKGDVFHKTRPTGVKAARKTRTNQTQLHVQEAIAKVPKKPAIKGTRK